MSEQHPMMIRRAAVDACAKKFVDRPVKWGERDCVKLFALALRKQGFGIIEPLKGVRYRTKTSGMKRFKESGFPNLVDAVDKLGLTRIAPSMTLPGDIVAMQAPDDDPFGASLMVVHTGATRRLIGLDGEGMFRVVIPDMKFVLAAWRV